MKQNAIKATIWMGILCVVAVVMAWNGTMTYMEIITLSAIALIGPLTLWKAGKELLKNHFAKDNDCEHRRHSRLDRE